MSETRAIPTSLLVQANPDSPAGLPLCPRCLAGYLQPYKVTIGLCAHAAGGYDGADWLEGWVAVCQGNQPYLTHLSDLLQSMGEEHLPPPEREVVASCGFTMPMTGGRFTAAQRRPITPAEGL